MIGKYTRQGEGRPQELMPEAGRGLSESAK
jgi:hypothetical protein